jgi:8-oxo-dGTP pyrophosphatase MutT (NUDIX family)
MTNLERIAERIRKRLIHLAGGKTVGVRAIVVNRDGKVLLLRHTYRDGWHLPGGGVERGESPEAAIIREVREEANIFVEGRPRLFAVYLSEHQGVDDYPLVYIVDSFRSETPKANAEIAEVGWFRFDETPPETTAATRRRIEEFRGALEPAITWRPEA